MAKSRLRTVLLVGVLAALGACAKKSAPSARIDPVDTGPLQAAIGRIFGGALVPAPRPGGRPGQLAYRYAGGQILLDVARHGRGLRIRVKATGISLETLGESALLRGTLEGDGTLTTSGAADALRGDVTVRCLRCTLGGGKVSMTAGATAGGDPMLIPHVTVPSLSLGRVSCRLELAEGRATFRQCAVRSADLTAELTGHLALRDPLRDTRVAAQLRLRLTEALMARNPKWRIIEAALPGAREAGSHVLTLRGRLASLRLRPTRAGRRPPPRGKPVPPSTLPPARPGGPLPASAVQRQRSR